MAARRTVDTIFSHFGRPLAVVHIERHEVDLSFVGLLDVQCVRQQLAANLTPATAQLAVGISHSGTSSSLSRDDIAAVRHLRLSDEMHGEADKSSTESTPAGVKLNH